MFRSSKKGSQKPAPPPVEATDERTRILLEALSDLAATLDLDEVLDRVLARSLEVSGAEQALVLLGDEQTGLTARRALSSDGKSLEADEVAFSSSTVRRALSEGKPVIQELGSDTEALAAGQSLFELKLRSVMCAPMSFRGDTLGAIYVDSRVQRKTFTPADRELFEALSRHAAIAIQNARLLKASTERARLARELELAVEIQRDILPAGTVSLPRLEAAGSCVACEEISGDFFDFIPQPDGRLALWVADVTGHGVGPALLAAEVRGEIRALLPLGEEPGKVLSRVHDNLRMTIDPGRFLTLFLAIVDPETGSLTYASAGHPEGLLWKGGEAAWLNLTGPPLGVDVEIDHETQRVEGLRPGDGLLLYSDGLVEARDRAGELYGQERLAEFAIRSQGSAEAQVEAILAEVAGFNAGRRNDDRTAVVVLWKDA